MAKKVSDERIIKALLENESQQKAAKSIGITIQTIITRMKNPEFIDKYHSAQNELLRATTRKLANASCECVDLLIEKMRDENTSDRLRVEIAYKILNLQRDYTTIDEIQRRITAIENDNNCNDAKEQSDQFTRLRALD